MAAGGGGYEFCGSFDLGVEGLHLGGVEDAEVGDGGADVAPAVYVKMIKRAR